MAMKKDHLAFGGGRALSQVVNYKSIIKLRKGEMTKVYLFFLRRTVSFKTAGQPSVLSLAVFSSVQKAATQNL